MLKLKTSQRYYNPKSGEYYFIYTLVSDVNGNIENPIDNELPPPDDIEIIYVDSIQEAMDKLVGNAPPDRNTLEKIANYLDLKVDKINGYELSENNFTTYYKEKLDTVETGANRYIHPLSHPAELIEEDDSRKFFTIQEREKLRNIDTYANQYVHPETHSVDIIEESVNNKIMTSLEREKLRNIDDGANLYIHPNTHSADMIDENIMKNFVSYYEKEFWNKKAEIEDIDRRIDALLGTSSENLNTLNQISKILNESDDIEFSILTSISNKLDKEDGKVLTDQNFTVEEKTKLANIDFNANYYEHPDKHHASMIDDLDFFISNHRDVLLLKTRDHDKEHNINSVSNHEGVYNSERDNIVLFNDVGLFKDSKKKLPFTDLVGKDDEQTITKKKIENCVIGSETPTKGSFTLLTGGIPSYDYSGNVRLYSKQMSGSIVYLDVIRDDDLFWTDVPYTYDVVLPSALECIEGGWTRLHVISNMEIKLIPDVNDRIRYKGISNIPGKEISIDLFAGNMVFIHKDSLLGWTILSEK